MTTRKPLLLSLSGAVTLALISPDSFSFTHVPDDLSTQYPTILAVSAAGMALAGAWYRFCRARSSTQAVGKRIERQLQALEKLEIQVGRAEQVLSLKCDYMTHQVRAELRQALYAITTDTIRTIGGLRRKVALTDKQFRILMARSDEFFNSLEKACASEVLSSQADDMPFLMPARNHPLPKPVPQSRPPEPLITQVPDPLPRASIPMPKKPRPNGANADASESEGIPAVLTSALVLGGAMYSGNELFESSDEPSGADHIDAAEY